MMFLAKKTTHDADGKKFEKQNILPNGNGLHGDHSFYGIENPSKLTKKKTDPKDFNG